VSSRTSDDCTVPPPVDCADRCACAAAENTAESSADSAPPITFFAAFFPSLDPFSST
jgi:hypothetical protein